MGDLKLDNCHKGFKRIAWDIRGPRGVRGLAGTGQQQVHNDSGRPPSGDCANQFDSNPETGDFNGAWRRSITGDFDYNPDATMPASGSWDDFIHAFFAANGESPTVTDNSYEFDYYACGFHWRDAAYPYPNIVDSGSIGDC